LLVQRNLVSVSCAEQNTFSVVKMRARHLPLALLCLLIPKNQLQLSSALAVDKKSSSFFPIRKVAVVGMGIAGLSLAHALENSADVSPGIEVTMFEARSNLDFKTGAGVQITGGK
jgi:hypothetical protein